LRELAEYLERREKVNNGEIDHDLSRQIYTVSEKVRELGKRVIQY
jgi:hypothetical protein